MSKSTVGTPDSNDNEAPKESPSALEQSVDSQAVEAASQSGYDWNSMLLPEDAAGDFRTTEVPGVPRLKRPPNTQFFRTRKGHCGNIYTLETDYDGERTVYLVPPPHQAARQAVRQRMNVRLHHREKLGQGNDIRLAVGEQGLHLLIRVRPPSHS